MSRSCASFRYEFKHGENEGGRFHMVEESLHGVECLVVRAFALRDGARQREDRRLGARAAELEGRQIASRSCRCQRRTPNSI